ncbi:hypothetical protein [Mycobacterium paraseoulense]|nr:hypothetical protein [Mycobacterium paraseoulense]MCV7396699.1 hypothetical protein [Mycobacterium paraseoulense]
MQKMALGPTVVDIVGAVAANSDPSVAATLVAVDEVDTGRFGIAAGFHG